MASDSSGSVPANVRSLAARLAELRPMRRGSLSERYVKCNKPGCACGQDPQARHGPYHSLTRTVGGQTRSQWVPADQAVRIREQIAAGQQFRQQVEALWAACEQWAADESTTTSSAREVEKGGSRRRSRRRSRPKSKR
ncbi:MAG: DUF6788 family protein [candidate division NC10 bacterium]